MTTSLFTPSRLDVLVNCHDNRAIEILMSMRELILRYGYRKVTVQDIADQARVGKGTIYLHWGSKDDLLDDLLIYQAQCLTDTVLVQLQRNPSLVTLGRTAAEFYRCIAKDPLLWAYNQDDVTVLGSRRSGPSSLDRLGISIASMVSEPAYLGILKDRGIVVPDAVSAAGRAAISSMVRGMVSSTISPYEMNNIVESARILSVILQRSFGVSCVNNDHRCADAVNDLVALSKSDREFVLADR